MAGAEWERRLRRGLIYLQIRATPDPTQDSASKSTEAHIPMLMLIPGPVTTDPAVRAAAAQDYAPWDRDFLGLVERIRARVRDLAGGREGEHVTLPLQGCGHFAVEAAIRTFVPPDGRVLTPMSGHYAERLARLATEAGRVAVPLPVGETERIDPDAVAAALAADPAISHLAVVQSETSTGIVHDLPALAAAAGRMGRRVIVDAVSAFGALPLDLGAMPMVDSAAFTSNKCLEGLPGASFTVARVDALERGRGRAGSWSLDLADVYDHALRVGWGSHRHTPAAGVLAAFDVALDLLDREGGSPARLARYTANMRALTEGLTARGFATCLPAVLQGPVVVNVQAPSGPNWDLQVFIDALKRRGVLISNFRCTETPSFRVGCIGAVTPDDLRRAAAAMADTLEDLGHRPQQAA